MQIYYAEICTCRKGELYADGSLPEFYPTHFEKMAAKRFLKASAIALRSAHTGSWVLHDEGKVIASSDLKYDPRWYSEPRYFGIHVGGKHIMKVKE